MYQYFLRRKVLEETKQTKGKNPLITGDAIPLNLIWNRYFFGLTLKKYKLHTSPHFQNMPKNDLLT